MVLPFPAPVEGGDAPFSRSAACLIAWSSVASTRRQYGDRFHFQKCALTRELRDLKGGAGRRRRDVDELVAHLAIDRKLRPDVGEKGIKLDDVFHFAAGAFDRGFQVLINQRRLLAKIRALLAGAVVSELSRDIVRAAGAVDLDNMGVA